jgi:hypothetical protein
MKEKQMLHLPLKPTTCPELLDAQRELTAAYMRFAATLRNLNPALAADFGAASSGLLAALSFVDDMLFDDVRSA